MRSYQGPTQEEVRKALAERSLRHFVKQAWPIVEPSTPFISGWHLDAITEHLEAVSRGEIRKLLINMPPRHMKSLAVSVFWPVWEWTTKPQTRWLTASYAGPLAIRDCLKSRRIIQSPWYQERWGNVYQLAGDQNAKSRYDNTSTGYRITASVGGVATGEGGDRILVDDPHSAQQAASDAERNTALTWWRETMSTRGNDPKTVARVIVMQRLHEQDLSGHVLTEDSGWEHLCLPAEYEPKIQVYVSAIGWQDPRKESGDLLWPERFGPAELADLKRSLGSYGSAGQLQQRPSPAEGGMFKRHWWRFWHLPGQPLPEVPVRKADGSVHLCPCEPLPDSFELELQSWDATFKDTKDSDYVVGQAWGKKLANRYLLDQVRDRMDFPRTIAEVKAFSLKHPRATTKLIEDKANGPAIISTLRSEIVGLIPIEPTGSKVARAAAASPQVESGNVYLPHPSLAEWVEGFIDEHANFPAGAHDDQVDGTSQALNRISGEQELYFA